MNRLSFFPYNTFSQQSKIRMFCFTYSGGTASNFRTWLNHFPLSIELCPIQLPGRETRISDELIFTMDHLVDSLWPEIHSLLDRPCILFGHSLGAVIAYEIAKKIESFSNQLKFLFVSACSAPKLFMKNVTNIHLESDEQFIETLKGYGAMHTQILKNKEALDLLLPRIRADFSIFETYIYRATAPLKSSIVGCCGLQDEIVAPEKIKAWAAETTSNFYFHEFQGGHFYHQISEKMLCQSLLQHIQSVAEFTAL